ncbi:hypothetical protein [Reyranella sp.]|uniref:hypothetical protein n=1 Tax=Reyranella sp. TaxID=1929291 RepID=UPI003D0F3E49
MQRTLLILALITAAGASYAQTMEPTDPYGRPLVGRNDWVRQPGDQAGPGGMQSRPQYGESAVMNYGSNMATAPATQPRAAGEKLTRNNKLERGHATGPEPIPMDATGPRQTAFTDEYGFRYDSQGNRLDARGNIISPHVPQR